MTPAQAREVLKGNIDVGPNGEVDQISGWQRPEGRLEFAEWGRGDTAIRLDGDFSADELEAMAIIMREGRL